MSVISKCPKCQQPVTIHDGLDPGAEVRCPLCAAAYPLSDALAEAPPALIPVDPGAISGPAPDSEAMLESDLISEPFHVPQSDDLAGPSPETEPPAGAAPTLDAWQKVDAAPEIHTGAVGPTEAPADVETFAIAGEELGDLRELTDERLLRKRRRKTEKGIVRHAVEVIGGGLLGLLIGYYILCWVGPSSLDLPRLPLPLLPHTMDKPAAPGEDAPEETKEERGKTRSDEGDSDGG